MSTSAKASDTTFRDAEEVYAAPVAEHLQRKASSRKKSQKWSKTEDEAEERAARFASEAGSASRPALTQVNHTPPKRLSVVNLSAIAQQEKEVSE